MAHTLLHILTTQSYLKRKKSLELQQQADYIYHLQKNLVGGDI